VPCTMSDTPRGRTPNRLPVRRATDLAYSWCVPRTTGGLFRLTTEVRGCTSSYRSLV
jgi:hypothetical protein